MFCTTLIRGLVASLALFVFLAPAAADDSKVDYPETRTVDVVDVYHGVEVADPYRWLEDQYADEVADLDVIEATAEFAVQAVVDRIVGEDYDFFGRVLEPLLDLGQTQPSRIR